jgi:hypothetical protein
MRRLSREDLTADILGFPDAADAAQTAGFSGKIGNAGSRQADGKRIRSCRGLVASFAGRAPLFSIHVPPTGPIRV